jgi:uncharacterized protein
MDIQDDSHTNQKKVDCKALWCFLAVAFGGAWLVILTLDSIWPYSVVNLMISHSTAMLMPGIGAIVARRYIQHAPIVKPGWYRGSPIIAVIIIFACAALWGIPRLIDIIWGGSKLGPIGFWLYVWIVVSAIEYLIPAFGEELGWRGFLLPELLPIGTGKAVTLHGAIWGLWHWPIVIAPFIHEAFTAQGSFSLSESLIVIIMALPAMAIISIFLGTIFGYVALRFGGLLLVTVMHAYYDYFRDTLGLVLVPGKFLDNLMPIVSVVIIFAGIICFIKLRKIKM